MQKTIVFILSANFSGSHFLSLLLGSHSKASHLGEVKNLVKIKNTNPELPASVESSRQCYICKNNQECKITSGLHKLNKNQIYPTLFSRHDPSITHLIDASKKTSWAKHFLENPNYKLKFIHLVRDPRALVRKWDLHYPNLTKQKIKQFRFFPSKIPQLFWRPAWQTYSLKWVEKNYEIYKFTKKFHLDSKTITYEELAMNPESTLSSLMGWLDLDFEKTQIKYWEHEHHGTQKQKYNSNLEDNRSFVDIRWKKDISSIEQEKIISSPNILQLTSLLDLEINENGIFQKKLS